MNVRRLHCTDKAQIEVAEVELADPADGQIVVDKARKFLFEAGQWSDTSSFIESA